MTEHSDTPPPGFEREDDPAGQSTELPVVVLGDAAEVSGEVPRVRLLQGRLHERWILYPAYGLHLVAALGAVTFAMTTREWSVAPIALTWFVLFVWYWFYGVAYRYRRAILKFVSLSAIAGMTVSIAFFCLDRSSAQRAWVRDAVVDREADGLLVMSAVLTILPALGLLAHFVFLGRGYRRKS